jgi:protocatechuate 3,4-dioxygenase beta subunit
VSAQPGGGHAGWRTHVSARTRDDPDMTRSVVFATSLSLALAGTVLALAPNASAAQPPAATAPAALAEGDGPPNTYFSTPPELLGRESGPAAAQSGRPKPPKTRGRVTGQVVGPNGTPIRHALVTGIRFSDLGLPADLGQERRVLARTNGSGRFTLKQLREPYLVRVCSEAVLDAGDRARRSGECDEESTQQITPSYLGPDGNLDSWMRHTRMFRPQQPTRALGRVVVQPPAVVAGTFKDGPRRVVYLTRIDGTIAAQTVTDDQGHYRFEVAPGPYRVEADRDEGLRTGSTVPGYRSRRLLLRSGRTAQVTFRTRHAGIVRGLVTTNGVPLPDQFLAILDQDGAFAAGVVTNEIGRYVVSSLAPGAYTVTTSYAGSAYVPKSQIVAVDKTTVATADLALDQGRSVSFSAADVVFPGASGSVDAELRNPDGRVVKAYQGNPALEPGASVTFTGLPMNTYSLYVRRSAVPADGSGQVDFPWVAAAVDLVGNPSVNLGPLLLSQPTLNLSGTLPPGGQVRLTSVPEDAWLRSAQVDGDQATPMARSWTAPETGGQYVVRGVVPGTYAAAVTTAPREREGRPSSTRGNLAATHTTVVVAGAAPTAALTAPAGATVRGELRYDRGNRPVIAPFGFVVTDAGDQSWQFPTVSDAQRYGRPFKVERLHAGPATGGLLDVDLDPGVLGDEHPNLLVPDSLLSSARTEPGTPYWFTARDRGFTLTAGTTLDLGVIKITLHGVSGPKFQGG